MRGSALPRVANSAWEAAELTAASLSGLPGIQGVLLFGSVARRRSDPESDIDMLVVGSIPGVTTRALLATLPANLRSWRLAIQYYTTGRLAELFAAGPAFTDHLRREGVVLYERGGSPERAPQFARPAGHEHRRRDRPAAQPEARSRPGRSTRGTSWLASPSCWRSPGRS